MPTTLLKARTISLRIMLVISLLSTCSWTFFDFSLGLLDTDQRDTMLEMYQTLSQKNTQYQAAAIMFEQQMAKPQWYCLLCTLLHAISVVGMVLMWRLRRNGFHYYTLSKLLLILMPLLFLDRTFVGFGDIMLALMFMAVYYIQLRNISLLQEAEAQQASTDNEAGTSDPDAGTAE